MRRVRSPLVQSSIRLLSSSLPSARTTGAGGVGHPPCGVVHGHCSLCAKVPTSEKQSWHLGSSAQPGTCATRDCGH
eukprot:6219663-Karenia_brevis.AAC.1